MIPTRERKRAMMRVSKVTREGPVKDSVKLLRRVGLKVTRSRIAMLDLLAERKTPMSADEITAALGEKSLTVDRVTVYRNLDRMLEADVLAPIYTSGRAMRVALRSHPGSPNHHFILCEVSGQVAEIDSAFLADCWQHAKDRIKAVTGWEMTGQVMQYIGISPEANGGNGDGKKSKSEREEARSA